MKIRNPKSAIRNFLSGFLSLSFVFSFSQDSIFRLALILPFETQSSAGKIDEYFATKDVFSANKIHLSDDAVAALDFYQGALKALDSIQGIKIQLSVYDCWNSDSVTKELLKKNELKNQDVIIGAVNASNSKLVAEFCKKNKILNVQPFTPSKSLTTANAYHLKLVPTIDAHVDAMFNSITDSFPGSNIIIYTPDADNSISVAQRFDSLFRDYNIMAEKKFTTALLNTKDMMLNGKKTTAADQLKEGIKNIWIITAFDESFVNGNFRVLFEKNEKFDIAAYGMPTWLWGENMRLDYVNRFNTRLTETFLVDSSKQETSEFITRYRTEYHLAPSRNAFMGFDAMNFITQCLSEYGKDFLPQITTQRYSGTAYKFDISKNTRGDEINYYENRHVNVFMVQDYLLRRVW